MLSVTDCPGGVRRQVHSPDNEVVGRVAAVWADMCVESSIEKRRMTRAGYFIGYFHVGESHWRLLCVRQGKVGFLFCSSSCHERCVPVSVK